MASPIEWTWVWANSGRGWKTEACRSAVHGVTKSQTRLSNWTTTTIYVCVYTYTHIYCCCCACVCMCVYIYTHIHTHILLLLYIYIYIYIHTHTCFPGSLAGKESTCNAGDPSSVLGLEKSPGEGIGYPLQYSCLENPHGQRSLAGYNPWSSRVRHDWATKHTHTHTHTHSWPLDNMFLNWVYPFVWRFFKICILLCLWSVVDWICKQRICECRRLTMGPQYSWILVTAQILELKATEEQL